MRHIFYFLSVMLFTASTVSAQYWQQSIAYKMDIDFDVKSHQYSGKQAIVYTNNSPDDLNQLFFHLYFNAFQPGSMMDVRSQSIADPDGRVGDRIGALSESEIGYTHIKSIKVNGVIQKVKEEGTIAQIDLSSPIKAGKKAKIEVEFNSQVPLQIRRSGRDNAEGVAYSMTQWYPKLSEYDNDGWHPNPYVGREFYGVWGDFEVNITIDETFTIGGTGILQNASAIGHGYKGIKEKKKGTNGKLTWNFKAENVHDFAWAADANYVHTYTTGPNGMEIHFFRKDEEELVENWTALEPIAVRIFESANKHFGTYPYAAYSIIQGGDGGMEYPMATLITGKRSLPSLAGVTAHEVMHSWFQMVLGTDEAQYPWMDEGFTTFATAIVQAELLGNTEKNLHKGSVGGYMALVDRNAQEPLTTHADRYIMNRGYGINSYSKGSLFLWQLQNIVGEEVFFKGMLTYFDTWKFKHPDPRKFIRVMEKESGMVLDWYLEDWVGTTNTIDYAVNEVSDAANGSEVILQKIGEMPMPLEVLVTLKSGKTELHYIPMSIMRGEKKDFLTDADSQITDADWPWTYPYYTLKLSHKKADIESIEIDPEGGIIDVKSENNYYPRNTNVTFK